MGKWIRIALIAIAIYTLSSISRISLATNLSPANANSLDSSITMLSPESETLHQRIRELVERQANAWATANSDKIITDFAEDSLFVVPGSTFRGKQQIKEAAEAYFAEFTDTQITIKRIITNGIEGAIEWSWRDTNKKTSETSQAEDAIILELEEGKIKYWREYIDK